MACLKPFTKKDGTLVPCGKCPRCRGRNVSSWSFRLRMLDKISISSYFITITYDNVSCPISRAGFMVLNKSHLQKWFKRVRDAHYRGLGDDVDGQPIKYFAVGEYGGRTMRPHYHVLIFNVNLELMVDKKDLLVLEHTDYDGRVPVKCKQWDFGFITVGKVTAASVGYCMKYMCKKSKIPMHCNDDRVMEFRLMSKGIGRNYITEETINWHKADLCGRMFIVIEGGKKIAMPRYLRKWIYQNLTIEQITEMRDYWKDRMESDYLRNVSKGKMKSVTQHLKEVENAIAAMERNAEQNRSGI